MDETPRDPEGTAAASHDEPNADIQAKMKEALERKHEAEQAGHAHLDAHSTNQRTHGKSGGGRQFRRKAGG
ncbi:MAG: DUF5302 domain-containing protein [Candidatus Nanopelagicales bacterium]|jgi:hypothetical protein